MLDGERARATAGESVRIPDGVVHAFSATGEGQARVMIVNAPGHMHAGVFADVGKPVEDDRRTPMPMDGPPDVAHVVQVAEKRDMTILATVNA